MKPKGATTYNTEDLENTALDAIEKYMLTSVDDICAFLPCDRATFYTHKLDKSDKIKELVYVNKIKIKQGIKAKWYKRDNVQAEKYLYLLLANQDERDALNGVK